MRRAAAAIVVVTVLAVSCNRGADPRAEDPAGSALPTTAGASTTPADLVPEIDPFVPLGDDVYVDLKRTAGRAVQHLSTYGVSESWSDVLARTADRFHVPRGALSGARGFYAPSTTSISEVVYPQLGGLDLVSAPQTASVMVVVLQRLEGGSTGSVSRTVDVRMERHDERWRVTSIESVGGEPTEVPDGLSRAARAVLESPNIELADSARWDIYRGEIDDRLLQLMSALARKYSYSVAVLKSGHPPHVYGSANLSNHTGGRAVDIWEVDDVAVVSQRADAGSSAYRLTQDALERGDVTEIGSPWDLDAGGSTSFSNDVHLDHVHLGFDY